jgi:hypothetical protein
LLRKQDATSGCGGNDANVCAVVTGNEDVQRQSVDVVGPEEMDAGGRQRLLVSGGEKQKPQAGLRFLS